MDPTIVLAGSENVIFGLTPVPKLVIRLSSGIIQRALTSIEQLWNRLTAGEEFEFRFVDEVLENQYRSDLNLGRIMNMATIISVCIVSQDVCSILADLTEPKSRCQRRFPVVSAVS